MTYTITTNPEFNSVEVIFDGKPCEEIRNALKALKFRWHSVKNAGMATPLKKPPAQLLKVKQSPKPHPRPSPQPKPKRSINLVFRLATSF